MQWPSRWPHETLRPTRLGARADEHRGGEHLLGAVVTFFPATPDGPLMPTIRMRWLRRESEPNQFDVRYRTKVLQQWWDCPFDDNLHGEWRDVPVEDSP